MPVNNLNFLLGCSENSLDNFRLSRMSEVANLRKELHTVFDKLIDEMIQVELALWFKTHDRQALQRALETEEDAETWARRMIRGGGDILPRLRMDPEEVSKHHVESVMEYQARNISAGKCQTCPEPLARNSVRYCKKHLEQQRTRKQAKSHASDKAPHGRHPNTLAALAKAREEQAKKREGEECASPSMPE